MIGLFIKTHFRKGRDLGNIILNSSSMRIQSDWHCILPKTVSYKTSELTYQHACDGANNKTTVHIYTNKKTRNKQCGRDGLDINAIKCTAHRTPIRTPSANTRNKFTQQTSVNIVAHSQLSG